jgi:hypothetical protein
MAQHSQSRGATSRADSPSIDLNNEVFRRNRLIKRKSPVIESIIREYADGTYSYQVVTGPDRQAHNFEPTDRHLSDDRQQVRLGPVKRFLSGLREYRVLEPAPLNKIVKASPPPVKIPKNVRRESYFSEQYFYMSFNWKNAGNIMKVYFHLNLNFRVPGTYRIEVDSPSRDHLDKRKHSVGLAPKGWDGERLLRYDEIELIPRHHWDRANRLFAVGLTRNNVEDFRAAKDILNRGHLRPLLPGT